MLAVTAAAASRGVESKLIGEGLRTFKGVRRRQEVRGNAGGVTVMRTGDTYLVGFKDFRMSYAAALSYVIVGGVLVLTLLFQVVQRWREARAA